MMVLNETFRLNYMPLGFGNVLEEEITSHLPMRPACYALAAFPPLYRYFCGSCIFVYETLYDGTLAATYETGTVHPRQVISTRLMSNPTSCH